MARIPSVRRGWRVCLNCKKEYKSRVLIDGKVRDLSARSYCTTCSPFGANNSQQLEMLRTDGKKTCVRCGADKPRGDFSAREGRCKPCVAADKRLDRQAFKRQCIEYLGGRCTSCGYDRCIAALDFHHRDPNEKEFEISRYRHWQFGDAIRRELDKCALLCRNCHAEEHADDSLFTHAQPPTAEDSAAAA